MKVRQLIASAFLFVMWSEAAFAQGPPSRRAPSENELWQRVEKANDAAMLEAFVAAFPNSPYLPEALKRLAALKPGTGGTRAGTAAPANPSSGSATAATRPPIATHETAPSTLVFRMEVFDVPRQGPQSGNGIRVDWCPRWANDCGKPAADAFCRGQGFSGSRSFRDELTGGPTWVIGDRQICAMKDCRALRRVECEGGGAPSAMPAEETIEGPRINGIALSSCVRASRGCGQEAASAFCAAAGFSSARAFGEDGVAASIHLGDRTHCSGPQCRRITHVVCSR